MVEIICKSEVPIRSADGRGSALPVYLNTDVFVEHTLLGHKNPKVGCLCEHGPGSLIKSRSTSPGSNVVVAPGVSVPLPIVKPAVVPEIVIPPVPPVCVVIVCPTESLLENVKFLKVQAFWPRTW